MNPSDAERWAHETEDAGSSRDRRHRDEALVPGRTRQIETAFAERFIEQIGLPLLTDRGGRAVAVPAVCGRRDCRCRATLQRIPKPR
jgi:hypothetical protein